MVLSRGNAFELKQAAVATVTSALPAQGGPFGSGRKADEKPDASGLATVIILKQAERMGFKRREGNKKFQVLLWESIQMIKSSGEPKRCSQE